MKAGLRTSWNAKKYYIPNIFGLRVWKIKNFRSKYVMNRHLWSPQENNSHLDQIFKPKEDRDEKQKSQLQWPEVYILILEGRTSKTNPQSAGFGPTTWTTPFLSSAVNSSSFQNTCPSRPLESSSQCFFTSHDPPFFGLIFPSFARLLTLFLLPYSSGLSPGVIQGQ